MKTCILFILFQTALLTQTLTDFYDLKVLDINNITVTLNNRGGLKFKKYDNLQRLSGAFWQKPPYGSMLVYDQGFWVVGKINNTIGASISKWENSYCYSSGPLINGRAASIINPLDSMRYRVYKLTKDNLFANMDFLQYPIDLGAPANNGSIIQYADQMLWSVFSFDSTRANTQWIYRHTYEPVQPLPIEIHQLAYAHKASQPDSINYLSDVIFFEWSVINKGLEQIDSAFISLWTDIDLNDGMENISAVDSTLNTAYMWDEDIDEFLDGQQVAGYTLLYGPTVYSPGDTAIFKGRILVDRKNLPLTSFHPILDDSIIPPYSLPSNIGEAWNIAGGFKNDGTPWIDSTTMTPTKFPFNGDPVQGKNWLQPRAGGGAGFNLFSGPFTLAPNDTQWVMMALVPVLEKNYKESIKLLRRKVSYLHLTPYNTLAGKVYLQSNEIPNEIILDQNYPNPFNPVTKIKYSLLSGVEKQYKVSLRVFDILGNEITTLIDGQKAAGMYEIEFNASSLSSGVYIYRLIVNEFVQSKKMVLIK